MGTKKGRNLRYWSVIDKATVRICRMSRIISYDDSDCLPYFLSDIKIKLKVAG